jgi:hypothetical protein
VPARFSISFWVLKGHIRWSLSPAFVVRQRVAGQTPAFLVAAGIGEPLRLQAQELRASTQGLFEHRGNPA